MIDLLGVLSPNFQSIMQVELGYDHGLVDGTLELLDGRPLITPTGGDFVSVEETLFAALVQACEPSDTHSWWGGLTRKWISHELSAVYSAARLVLSQSEWEIEVRAGVTPGIGTRHFRAHDSRGLVLHDLYDRMLIDWLRHSSTRTFTPRTRSSGMDVLTGLLAAVAAGAFASAEPTPPIHAQVLGNLKLAGWAASLEIWKGAGSRRSLQDSDIPMPQEAIIGDLFVAFHEVSHLAVGRDVEDAEELTNDVLSFVAGMLGRLSSESGGIVSQLVEWLELQRVRPSEKLAELVREIDADQRAIWFMDQIGLPYATQHAKVVGTLFGIVAVNGARRIGGQVALGASHEQCVETIGLGIVRLVGASAALPEDYFLSSGYEFVLDHVVLLTNGLANIESLLRDGLDGQVVYDLPRRLSDFFDGSAQGDDPRSPRQGEVECSSIGAWSSNLLLSFWGDYSKPLRGMEKAWEMFGSKGNRSDPRPSDVYLFLPGEL